MKGPDSSDVSAADVPARPSSELGSKIVGVLDDRREAMLALLERLVRAESPTDPPEAQEEVQRILTGELESTGLQVIRVGGESKRRHLLARPAGRASGEPIQLLLGHSDTVWPAGTIETMPFEVDGNVARGPGVFDMKGGLVQMISALFALKLVGADVPMAPVVFINSDEEKSSPTSRRNVRRLARAAHRAFVLEPALGREGRIKTARKGTGRFTVHIRGKSAHAGLDPEAGSSAILELSHVVQRLHELNDPEAGITVNVGTIDGGTRPNVVAAESRAEVDVRIQTTEQARRVEEEIRALQATVPGTQLEVEGTVGRPPMEPTPGSRRLWKQAQEAAAALGVDLQEGRSGGASDGNNASQFTPTLDGLGAVGDGAHARHEFCYVDKMVERSALLALLLLQPALPDA